MRDFTSTDIQNFQQGLKQAKDGLRQAASSLGNESRFYEQEGRSVLFTDTYYDLKDITKIINSLKGFEHNMQDRSVKWRRDD